MVLCLFDSARPGSPEYADLDGRTVGGGGGRRDAHWAWGKKSKTSCWGEMTPASMSERDLREEEEEEEEEEEREALRVTERRTREATTRTAERARRVIWRRGDVETSRRITSNIGVGGGARLQETEEEEEEGGGGRRRRESN